MQIISQFAPLPLAQPAKGTAVAMGSLTASISATGR